MQLPLIVFDSNALHLKFRQGDVLRYDPSDPTPWTLYRPLQRDPNPIAIAAAILNGTARTFDVSPICHAVSGRISGLSPRDLLLQLLKRSGGS